MTKHWFRQAGRALLTAGILLGATGATAFAATIIMQVVDVDRARGGSLQFELDGRLTTDFAGGIKIKLDNTPYEAYCVDLFHTIGYETLAVNAFAPEQVSNGPRAAWLYVTQYPSVSTVTAGEALQLAIWDIVHDEANGLTAGRIRASPAVGTPAAVVAAATEYLALSLGQSSGAASVYTMAQVPNTRQSLMSVYLGGGSGWPPAGNESAVPEPAGLTLVALGLVFLGTARGLRQRTARSAGRRGEATDRGELQSGVTSGQPESRPE